MPIPKNFPLESYDPRFEQLLLRGARGEDIKIQCRSKSKAYRLQHMLHSYRHRARDHFKDSAPERWQPLFTTCIGLMRDDNGQKTILHIYSRHSEFDDTLNSIAGTNDAPIITEANDPLAEFDPQPTAKSEGSGG